MSSTSWAALLVASVIGFVWLLWSKLAGPSPIPLSSQLKVREVFRTTLRNGARGARVRLQVSADPRLRVDFMKYFTEGGDVGLRAVLEHTPQSVKHLSAIKDALTRRGVLFVLSNDSTGREVMEIDVASDLMLAEAVAYGVFEEALGLSLARDVVGVYDLVLITNEPTITGVGDA